ncbi:MAG: addiction module protein [Burkholderiaceae bacterium]|nr:addiction module protein [Burkholderiaceae bacterium]
MNPTVDDLVAQAEQLSPDDLELLVLRLQQSLDRSADPTIEAAWMAEVERRADAMDRGEAKFHPWEEVRKDLGLT